MEFTFATDTATFCVFDPVALRHRLYDDADWWTLMDEELSEVNAGNVAFFDLGNDGLFHLALTLAAANGAKSIQLRVPSGRLFIGAAEEVTSGGLEPEGLRGAFLGVAPGDYVIAVAKSGSSLALSVVAGGNGKNSFSKSVSLV